MRQVHTLFIPLALTALLAGCSQVDGLLDDRPAAEPAAASPASAPAESAADGGKPRALASIGDFNGVQPPPPPKTAPAAAPAAVAPETGEADSARNAFVGDKVSQVERDLIAARQALERQWARFERLRDARRTSVNAYHAIVAHASDTLQAGSPPDNPILRRQSAEAKAGLGVVADNFASLERLRSEATRDVAVLGLMDEQVQAMGALSGLSAANRQELGRLGVETNAALIDGQRLLWEVDDSILRQSSFLAREERYLKGLDEAIRTGNGAALARRAPSSTRAADAGRPARAAAVREPAGRAGPSQAQPSQAQPTRAPSRAEPALPPLPRAAPSAAAAAEPGNPFAGRSPLVALAMEGEGAGYEGQLYTAVSRAVAANPAASFDVLGVMAGGREGASKAVAEAHAARVAQSLTRMGVPAGRLRQSLRTSEADGPDRVLVFAR